jgi:hypothetical protein
MKIRNMLGLAAVGGLLYLHKRRGGEWTMESFQDSAKQLWHGVQSSAEKAKEEAIRQLKDAKQAIASGAHKEAHGYSR